MVPCNNVTKRTKSQRILPLSQKKGIAKFYYKNSKSNMDNYFELWYLPMILKKSEKKSRSFKIVTLIAVLLNRFKQNLNKNHK